MDMEKASLRQEIRRRKQAYTPEQLQQLSKPVIERLLAHPAVKKANGICLYHSLPDEVFTHEAIEQLRTAGKQVYLPKVTGDGEMTFLPYEGGLEKGAFGIMEGTGGNASDTAWQQADIVVVPGIAFDAQGHRLGRGRGYYDRLLAATHPLPYLIGLCFPFQLVERVPTDLHDIAMNEVIS